VVEVVVRVLVAAVDDGAAERAGVQRLRGGGPERLPQAVGVRRPSILSIAWSA
jgi:hypothetical protein